MLTKVWQGSGEQVATEVISRLFTPGGIFWLGGLGSWLWHSSRTQSGGLEAVGDDLAELPTVLQLTILVTAVVAIFVTGVVTDRLSLPLLRVLEGYWPKGVGDLLRRRLFERREGGRERAVVLDDARRHRGVSAREQQELVRLMQRLRWSPGSVDQTMPTRFGNRLLAAELRVQGKYGLDPVACWPHLWLLLDAERRTELRQVRAELDTAAHAVWWSLALVVWTPLAWWALPAGVVLAAAGYYAWLLSAAERHGDLMEAAFDLYHPRLYEALRWPAPRAPEEEIGSGQALTAFLWQGLAPVDLRFSTSAAEPDEPGSERRAPSDGSP